MFLGLLNRKEKLKFLDLAIYMIDVDGEPTLVEKRLLETIKAELGKEIVDEYTFTRSDDVDMTIQFFKDSNKVVRNIIFLNLSKIMLVDDFYNTSEHILLEKIQKAFQITPEKRRELIKLVYEEKDLREKVKRALEDEETI
ncbi:MAG: hypothetical protein J6Y28_06175 [Acholeplasmatales bacterium]|nr:hypothetical protein [Acholeplasmatales bacterium]